MLADVKVKVGDNVPSSLESLFKFSNSQNLKPINYQLITHRALTSFKEKQTNFNYSEKRD